MSGPPAWKMARSTWTRAAGQQAVRDRSPHWCELRIPGVCLGRGASFSHRKPAGLGGGYDPSNGCRACGSGTTGCHGYVEHHPETVERFGWRIPYADPAQVPAFIWPRDAGRPSWTFLTDDGLYVHAEPDLVIEAGFQLVPEVPEWRRTA